MIANHIHDAIAQVRKMQELVLAKRNFRGYSGKARALGGLLALGGALFIHLSSLPQNQRSHLLVWGVVLCGSLVVNYGALTWWFLHDGEAKRDLKKLMPAIDAFPALAVGAIMTFVLIIHQQHALLPGTWMTLYGLVHMSYRNSLPGENYFVGLFYIFSGTACLFAFNDFFNPWPMGTVFFVGEGLGGFVFHRNASCRD